MFTINSPRLVCIKGALFLAAGLLAATALVVEITSWKAVALLAICVWSFCRFYYFAFYVIEHYVDGEYRFTGLCDFARYLARCRQARGR